VADHGAALEGDGGAGAVGGAQVAILDRGRVLIQFRPLPPGWELPGGHRHAGEDLEACAIREAREETGLHVRVLGLVGVYRWTGLRRAGDAVYAAEAIGGRRSRSIEAWRSRYVDASELPRTVFPWFRDRVDDALAFSPGRAPVVRVQRIGPFHVLLFGLSWLRVPVDALLRQRSGRG
jgi:8-oxo-dGTP pyrophosphatase MutT (NUDIX family)